MAPPDVMPATATGMAGSPPAISAGRSAPAGSSGGSTGSSAMVAANHAQPTAAGASSVEQSTQPTRPNEWRMMGYDEKNWFFNPEEHAISVDNAAQLSEKWRFSVSGMPIGTPTIADSKVFALASGGMYAIDFETGKQLWSREDIVGSSSVAYAAGFLYVQMNLPPQVFKLNATDGKTVWGPIRNCDDDTSCSGESSPVIVGDTLLVGMENNMAEASLTDNSEAMGKRGAVRALDTASGALRWLYYTIPTPGTEDGASVWSTVSVDLEAGTVYATTGNSYTVYGPNSDAFHALDLTTGERRWVNQVRRDDVYTASEGLAGDVTYDYDFGANPILALVNGRAVVAAGDKGGAFWMLDRATGNVLWSREDLSPSRSASYGGVFVNGAFDGKAFYVVSNDPQSQGAVLHRLDPERGGASTWSHALPQNTWGAISIANGVLFVPNNTVLFVMNAETGDVLQQIETGGTIGGGAASIAQGRVVVKSGMVWIDPATKLNDQIICYALAGGAVDQTSSKSSSAASKPASFRALYRDVIVGAGCNGGQCHSRSAAGGLDMSSQDLAYANLVGIQAAGGCASSGLRRVQPGAPEQSLIVAKLDHTQSCGGPMPSVSTLLPAAKRDALRAWIMNGAMND